MRPKIQDFPQKDQKKHFFIKKTILFRRLRSIFTARSEKSPKKEADQQ